MRAWDYKEVGGSGNSPFTEGALDSEKKLLRTSTVNLSYNDPGYKDNLARAI